MASKFFLCKVLVWSLFLTSHLLGQVLCDDDFVIAAYLPEYRSYINTNNTALHLTDLILFSLQPESDGKLGPCCLEPHHFQQAREARAYKQKELPHSKPLKLWISIGGAGRSNSFGRVASSPQLRKNFIAGIKEKVKLEQLDGVDFDWEVPQGTTNNQNYMKLVKEAYEELFVKSGILISVALHAQQTLPPTFYDSVSRINLMTYDMIYSLGEHHAQMDRLQGAIQALLRAKCPRNRIVIGIPAYARHGKDPGDVKTYSELVDSMQDEGGLNDQTTNRSEWNGYLFDSPRDVRRKVDFAIQGKHAGIFFWELGQDKQHEELGPGGILLEAAAKQAKNRHKARPSSSEL